MSTVAPRPALGEPQARRGAPSRGAPRLAPDPTVPAAIGRGVAFALLALFAGLHWMVLLEPGEPGRAFDRLLVRRRWRAGRAARAPARLAAAGAGARAGWRRRSSRWRWRCSPAASPASCCGPTRWGELASAASSAASRRCRACACPTAASSRGSAWSIPLGGTVLLTLAALLAFWPRRERLGLPGAALIALVALYVVPAVALDFTARVPARRAARACSWWPSCALDKLRGQDARPAGGRAVAVVAGRLLVAPALDSGSPWWDYESWALEASAAKSTSFSWNHGYGPLDWPRDGRELLRVQAPSARVLEGGEPRRASTGSTGATPTSTATRWTRGRPTTCLDPQVDAGHLA